MNTNKIILNNVDNQTVDYLLFFILWKSVATVNCLVTKILQNIHFGVNYPFKAVPNNLYKSLYFTVLMHVLMYKTYITLILSSPDIFSISCISLQLSKQGMSVIIISRNREKLDRAAKKIGKAFTIDFSVSQ